MNDTLLTVAEVAARLKCHPHTIRRWIWDRKLRAVKVGDLVRVSEQEVMRFIKPVAVKKNPRPSRRGSLALIATMRKLKKKVNPADVKLMERMISEAEQPADWSNPLG
jgi:excisionase family DNA binding protein